MNSVWIRNFSNSIESWPGKISDTQKTEAPLPVENYHGVPMVPCTDYCLFYTTSGSAAGFLDFWISGFLDSWIPGFLDFWISVRLQAQAHWIPVCLCFRSLPVRQKHSLSALRSSWTRKKPRFVSYCVFILLGDILCCRGGSFYPRPSPFVLLSIHLCMLKHCGSLEVVQIRSWAKHKRYYTMFTLGSPAQSIASADWEWRRLLLWAETCAAIPLATPSLWANKSLNWRSADHVGTN